MNVLQRRTEQKPADVKTVSSPASSPLSKAEDLQLTPACAPRSTLTEVACNRAISRHKNSSSFRWREPAGASGAWPGTESKLQSDQQGQRHLAVPAHTRGEVMRNPLRELQGSTLTLWPQMTAYHSRGQSRQGDNPEAGLSATSAVRSKASLCLCAGASLCQRDQEMSLSWGLSAESLPRLKASSTQIIERCGRPGPQGLAPSSRSQVSWPGGGWVPPDEGQRGGG